MTNYIKKLLALAVVAGAMTALAEAPTPEVIWSHDFKTTEKESEAELTYTLDVRGNTVTDDAITIDQAVGAQITIGSAASFGGVGAVLVKYKNLATPAEGTRTLVALHETRDYKPGIRTSAANARTLTGYYQDTGVYTPSGNPTAPEEGYVLFSYSAAVGIAIHCGESLDSLAGGVNTGLHWSNANIQSFFVGGPKENTAHPAWDGMVIEGIAVFKNKFYTDATVTDFSDFVFPEPPPTGDFATPVLLLNVYKTTQVDGWLNHTQESGGIIGPVTDSTSGVGFTTTSVGNFGTQNKVDANFEDGEYVDIFGETHTSILEEIKTSLGLGEIAFNDDVFKTGVMNAGQNGNVATISGLDVDKTYVVYAGFGLSRSGVNYTCGFKLETSGAYGSCGAREYVVTEAGSHTTKALQYQTFDEGVELTPLHHNLMIVRLVDVVPTEAGEVKFTMRGGDRSGLNFLAVAEVTRNTQTKFMKYYYPLDGDATNLGTASDEGLLTTDGEPVFADGSPFGAKSLKSGNGNDLTGSYVLTDETNGLVDYETGWTLSFWVNPNGMNQWRDVCGFWIGNAQYKFENTANGDNAFQMYNNKDFPALETPIPYTPNEWQNIVIVSSGEDAITIYANGTEVTTWSPGGDNRIWGDSDVHALTKVIMGTKGLTDNRGSSALVGEFAVYDYVVNEEQIAYLAANAPKDFYAPKKELTRLYATVSSATTWGELVWTDEDGTVVEWVDGLPVTLTIADSSRLSFDTTVDVSSITLLGSAALVIDNGQTALPDDFLAKIKTNRFRGAVYRSWLSSTPNVIAFNFNSWAGNANNAGTSEENKLIANDNSNIPEMQLLGDAWHQNQDTVNQTSPIDVFVYDGANHRMSTTDKALITWSAPNRHAWRNATDKILRGYLDDSGNEANVCKVNYTDIPFASYDAIVICATDTANKKFSPVKVNDRFYRWNDEIGKTVVTSSAADTWGQAQGTTVEYGRNAIRIANLTSSTLTIAGGLNGNGARGGIAAVILVETSVEAYDTVCDTVKSVSAANALGRTESIVNIHLSSGTVFDIDAEPTRDYTIVCDGDEKNRAIILNLDEAGGTPIPAAYLAKLSFVNCDPVVRLDSPHEGYDNLPITKIYHYVKTPLETSSVGNVYMKGAGAADAPVQIAHNGGWAELRSASASDVYYLAESYNDTVSTVRMIDAKVVYSDIFGLGMATYELKGTTEVTAPRFILSDGQANRTSNFLMQDTAKVYVTGANNTVTNIDGNISSIMFGHWDGPSTFTIRDQAEFRAPLAQILVGRTSNNQTINIEGGIFETKGIKLSASANGTNTLNLVGGTLKLGDMGITRYEEQQELTINVGGTVTIEVADGVTAPIAFPITELDAEDPTHAIVKTGLGTLDIGTNRPRMDVREGKVRLVATEEEINAGVLELRVAENAAQGANDKVEVMDGIGTAIGIESVSVDDVAHTVRISLKTAKITASMSMSEIKTTYPNGGTLSVIGSEACDDSVTITLDAAVGDEYSFVISDHVTFATAGGVRQIPLSRIALNEGACLVLAGEPDLTTYTIHPNRTIITRFDGGQKAYTFTNNGTLKTENNIGYTLTNADNATNIVVRGTATVTASAQQAIKGIVTIEKGATFINTYKDAIAYSGSPTTVNVYGTLDMGETRWTVGSQSQINLYGSAQVTGVGEGGGVLDIYRNGNTISVFNVEGEEPAAATIEGAIRVRHTDGNIWIQSGATLALPGGLRTEEIGNAKVTRQGAGHLTGTIPLVDNGNKKLTLDYGTQQSNLTAHFRVKSGEVTLHLTGKDGTSEVICANDSETDPFVEIDSGATLNLNGNNYSGSLGSLAMTGWIVNHGTLVFKDGNGYRYFRQHLVLDSGTVTVNSGDQPLYLYGGKGEGANAQIIARGNSSIGVGEVGSGNGKIVLGHAEDATPGAGIFVDRDATLTITAPVEGNDVLTKWGEGTLNLGTSRVRLEIFGGKIALHATYDERMAGVIRLPASVNQQLLTTGQFEVTNDQQEVIPVDRIEIDGENGEVLLHMDSNVITKSGPVNEWSYSLSGTVIVNNSGTGPIQIVMNDAFPDKLTQIDAIGEVEFIMTTTLASYGEVKLNVAEGARVTIKGGDYPFAGGIIGTGDLYFDPGEGRSMTVNTDNSTFTGSCTIASGSVKMGHNHAFGAWNYNRIVRVLEGACLDTNGMSNTGSETSYCIRLKEGAVYTNTAQEHTDVKMAFPVSKLILEGNAFIRAEEHRIGLSRHWNYETGIEFNGYTLTKLGKNEAYFSHVVMSGNGTFDVKEGSLRFAHNYGGGQPNFANGTIIIREDTVVKMEKYVNGTTLTVKKLINDGRFESTDASTGAAAITGELSGKGVFFTPVTLGANATLKLVTSGAITFAKTLTSERGSAAIQLSSDGLDTAKNTRLSVLRVTDEANLPAAEKIVKPTACNRWQLILDADGLGYRLVKPYFILIIK